MVSWHIPVFLGVVLKILSDFRVYGCGPYFCTVSPFKKEVGVGGQSLLTYCSITVGGRKYR